MQEAVLRLFNGVFVESKGGNPPTNGAVKKGIRNGYILSADINCEEKSLLDKIEDIFGRSGEKVNNTFQSSWQKVRNTPQENLYLEQTLHYLTTYVYQGLGIYSDDTIYIPYKELQIPYIKEDLPLTVIKAFTKKELEQKIKRIGSSGIALSSNSLQDIITIIKKLQLDIVPNEVSNRELKTHLHIYKGTAPENPVEYLRFAIYVLTGETLLIKNSDLIDKIKESDPVEIDTLILKAPDYLASIFFRYKPLFLAMKYASSNKTFFNRLRKKAKRLHSPLPVDFLNNVTNELKKGTLDLDELKEALKRVNIFRKIRLLYALNFRLNKNESIVHKIRNGKGWVQSFTWDGDEYKTLKAFALTYKSVVDTLAQKIKGKTIYIPPYIEYALPSSEKQFTGNFPSGTYVEVDKDLIAGIHWVNNCRAIDLDLSIIGESGKIGWDSSYTSEDFKILFSGDITSAPKPLGATELFYIKKEIDEPKLLYVNFYNHIKEEDEEIPCKLLVAQNELNDLPKNYMVDPNKILAQANIKLDKKQNIIGLIYPAPCTRLYFSQVSIGCSISSTNTSQSSQTREYLISNMVNSISLRDVLRDAGGVCVTTKVTLDKEYIDLSPESLDKTTIIDLILT